MWLFLVLACATPYPGACQQYEKLFCNTCKLSDSEKTYCTCIQKRKLTADDFSGKDKPTDDDAQLQCDVWLNALAYPSPSGSASCQQRLVVMREHGVDVCPENQDTGMTGADSGF